MCAYSVEIEALRSILLIQAFGGAEVNSMWFIPGITTTGKFCLGWEGRGLRILK